MGFSSLSRLSEWQRARECPGYSGISHKQMTFLCAGVLKNKKRQEHSVSGLKGLHKRISQKMPTSRLEGEIDR